jgi:hypothetical protein
MEFNAVQDAVKSLEKANANLGPELLSADDARELLAVYARAVKLASYGQTALARKIDNAVEVARTLRCLHGQGQGDRGRGQALGDAPEVSDVFKGGDISLDQATEIARAEQAQPGSATELLEVAERESFQVLRERPARSCWRPNSSGA